MRGRGDGRTLRRAVSSSWPGMRRPRRRGASPRIRVLRDVGERYLQSSLAGLLAEAVFIQGRWADAEALARETEELAAADDVDAQMLWRLQQARVSAARGEVADAERLAREAVELLEPTDNVVSKIAALATLGRSCGRRVTEQEADKRLARARELAAAKGSSVVLEQVPGLAAYLPASPAPR